MRQVIITPVLNGFKVQVGCQEVVFRDIDELCSELRRYQKAPAVVEKEYLEKAVNKGLMTQAVPEPQMQPPMDMRAVEAARPPSRHGRAVRDLPPPEGMGSSLNETTR